VGPAWTRGEIERPQGEKDVGGSTVSFYTQEQQQRLGVDEQGNTVVCGLVCALAPAPASPLVATHRGTHPHHTHTVTHHTILYSHHQLNSSRHSPTSYAHYTVTTPHNPKPTACWLT
jgi:hypothetical protein